MSKACCVRGGGPGVPCGHLFPRHQPGLWLGQPCPCTLLCWGRQAGGSGTCWDNVWDKRPRGKEEAARGVAQRGGGGCPGQCPPAQQRCSARGSLGLGISCFGPQREFPSPSWGETGSQHDPPGKWDGSVLAPRAGGTALAAIPPCLPAESGGASPPRRVGLCPAPAGVLQAARSTGLCPGKPHRDTTALSRAPCWGAGGVGEELEIILPWGQSLSGAGAL